MPRAAVFVAVALLVAGIAALVPRWLLDERDHLAVTPQPPAVEQHTEVKLPADGRACMNLVALDEHSEEARVHTAAKGRTVPLEITIRGEDGYVARGRASADYRPGDVVALPVDPPPESLIATLCVHNAGERSTWLDAVQDRRRSRSTVYVDGVPATVSFVIQFAERQPVSILERLPDSLRRMTVLRPAVVSEVTLWLLLVLFVAGIPIVALWAFARAVGEDER
jgi:hypothetical protein